MIAKKQVETLSMLDINKIMTEDRLMYIDAGYVFHHEIRIKILNKLILIRRTINDLFPDINRLDICDSNICDPRILDNFGIPAVGENFPADASGEPQEIEELTTKELLRNTFRDVFTIMGDKFQYYVGDYSLRPNTIEIIQEYLLNGSKELYTKIVNVITGRPITEYSGMSGGSTKIIRNFMMR